MNAGSSRATPPRGRLPEQAVRVGLVGCGRLAELAYLPALAAARGVELVAVADPDPGRRARAGVTGYASARELLEAERLDGLVLATPAAVHVADATLAAERGVRSLVEKPPAPTAAAARLLAELAPPPFVGFNRRFDPDLKTLRKALPYDRPVELELELRTRPGSWRPYSVRDDVLLDLAPHAIDLASWLAGAEPRRVSCALEGGDARLWLELARGRGIAWIRCTHGRRYRERVAALGGGADGLRVDRGGLRSFLARDDVHPLVPSLTRQLEAFARAVGGEQAPDLATAEEGVAVMATIDAARRSAAALSAALPVE